MTKTPLKFGKVYITIKQVATVLGWSRKRTTDWLEQAGCLVTIGEGKRRYTTRELLKKGFPDVFAEVTDSEYEEKEY